MHIVFTPIAMSSGLVLLAGNRGRGCEGNITAGGGILLSYVLKLLSVVYYIPVRCKYCDCLVR